MPAATIALLVGNTNVDFETETPWLVARSGTSFSFHPSRKRMWVREADADRSGSSNEQPSGPSR